MYTLSCKDLGVKDCHYVAKGEDAQGVVDDMMNHAKTDHKEKVAEMASTMSISQINDLMTSKVKNM